MSDVFQIKAVRIGFEGNEAMRGTLVVTRKGSDEEERYAVPLANEVILNEGDALGFIPEAPAWAANPLKTIVLDPRELLR